MSCTADPRVSARPYNLGLTLIGLCAVVLVLMPFAVDYVPVLDIDWAWQATPPVALVLPCIILPPAISLAYIFHHVTGRFPERTTAGGFVLAGISAVAFMASLFRDFESFDLSLLWATAPFFVAFASAAWLSGKCVDELRACRGLIAMQCVYVILIVFAFTMAVAWGRFQIGAWLGMAATSAYVVQISLALRRPTFIIFLLAPLGLIGLVFSALFGGDWPGKLSYIEVN